ncbi:DMT family transporter [candidate division KSB1 bacterium]
MAFPFDASLHAWTWLSVSGLIGFVAGDYFLFKSYPIISSRIAMVIMTLVPPITAFLGWLIMDEILSLLHFLGMILVIGGIIMVVLSRSKNKNGLKFSYPIKGILFAFLGTVGQAVGLVLSKYGMNDYDAFASTQIRIIAGLIGFSFIVTYYKRWSKVVATFQNKKAMKGITIGSFFGPFLGVSFSLISIQLIATGVASTIMAIVPVLIIAPSLIIFKQKITLKEIIGAVISVIGVAVLFQ